MYKNLNAGAIGIRNYPLEDTIKLARATGFSGIDFDIKAVTQLAKDKGIDHVKALFTDNGIQPGAWSPPVDWRGDEATWKNDLQTLPQHAETAVALGALRASTWILPASADRAFDENYQFHSDRLGGIAEVLKPYNIRFGLEFIGPESMRPSDQHEFVYTMEDMLGLCNDIGTGNMGLLLDAWHLYTSGGDVMDMDKLTNHDIVNVHVNDAPEGLTMAEYIDQDRRLPMETGVLPLEGFMKKLIAIGYDGPVTPEPFSARVNAIEDPTEAAQLTAEHMAKLWDVAGLN